MDSQEDGLTAKMCSRVGKPVKFTYPEGIKIGILRERVIIPSDPGTTGIPYWDVVDLIEFPEEVQKEWIRIGYYRKPGARLIFAGQTTITEPISIWKRLLTKAAIEKPWFRSLLEDVIRETNEQLVTPITST